MEKNTPVTSFISPQPFISIITPVYNGAAYLDELIISILEQDYPHYEHLIIDDGSNDNGATVAILKNYPHLRWWSRENKGQYATLNEGLAAANGEIITVICADDKYASSTVLSDVVNFWQQHPDCGAMYGDTLRMNEQSQLLTLDPTLPKPPYSAWLIQHWSLIQHCSLFVAKVLIDDKQLNFDLSFCYASDWDWMIRLSQATSFAYFSQPLSVYREHFQQTTSKTSKKTLFQENRQLRQRYGGNPALYWLLIYRHRVLKALWIYRTQGFISLYQNTKKWLNR